MPNNPTRNHRAWFLSLLVGWFAFGAFWLVIVNRCKADIRGIDGLPNPSLVQLLTNPNVYDGKRVVVKGYFLWDFELSCLFLSKEAAATASFADSLWVELKAMEPIDKRSDIHIEPIVADYVTVVGVFHYPRQGGVGHMSGCPGGLSDITSLIKDETSFVDLVKNEARNRLKHGSALVNYATNFPVRPSHPSPTIRNPAWLLIFLATIAGMFGGLLSFLTFSWLARRRPTV